MTIEDIQQQIVEDFSFLTQWEDKYEYLIDLGKSFPDIDDSLKREEYLIKGCQSRVWLVPEFKDGKIFFKASSDAIITKGIVSLLVKVFSGQSPKDILASNMEFIQTIGLKEHLSPTRANGLVSMIEQIRSYALQNSNN